MQTSWAGLTSKLFSVFLLTSAFGPLAMAQESVRSNNNAPPTFHMTGSAELLSHYVEHGLSQTDKAPALQGSFWFNFGPQFRLGLWGSNVKFPASDANIVLKPTADIKVIFSPNTDLILKYSENKYYNSNERDGNTVGLHMLTFGYRITYEIWSNWEGTHTSANYFSLGKVMSLWGGSWKWDNEGGYTMLKADGFSNYFDVRTMLGYQVTSQIFVQGGLTATSSKDQFNGAGDYFLILSARTEF